jgi:hypothetical protein
MVDYTVNDAGRVSKMGEKLHDDFDTFECDADEDECLCAQCDNDNCSRNDTCGWCQSTGLEDEVVVCGNFKEDNHAT